MDPLIRRCVQGEKEAFEEFIRNYSPLVRSTTYQVLAKYSYPPRKEDVEDLHNGLFLLLMEDDFRRLRQFEGRSSFASYCRIIVIRYVQGFLRSQKSGFSVHSNSTPEALADRSALPDDRVGLTEQEELLKQVLKAFSPTEQLLLKLTFEKGLCPREIAGVMGISMTAYYNKKSRILKRIKKKVREI